VGRAEPLPRVLCKGEGLPRERSSAGHGVAIIPRCVVTARRPDLCGKGSRGAKLSPHANVGGLGRKRIQGVAGCQSQYPGRRPFGLLMAWVSGISAANLKVPLDGTGVEGRMVRREPGM